MSSLPIGTILIYSLTGAPTHYLLCNGTSYSRTTYSSLYDVIGTTYGSDDSSTFKVPNFTSKFPIGTTTGNLGETGGSTSVSISKDNLPSHNHTIDMSFNHYHTISYSNSIYQKNYIKNAYPIGSTDSDIQNTFNYINNKCSINSSGISLNLDILPLLKLITIRTHYLII